ncbi:MAG: hypothetical protein NC308_10100 [Clostridium sp.]|nr:hypothetical protein [Bacteroides sp.]MCM1199227.1 hypothetical protein [Clostridium sp.]MCM1515746.1 hypothetical protein [Paraprevotella sp.]
MKSIKEIEDMDMGILEAIAEDDSIEAPDTLEELIMSTAAAGTVMEEEKELKGRGRIWRYAAFAATLTAAACMLVFLSIPSGPKDTFDDPLMAYAELERTFSYISSKMDKGLEIASEADPLFEKTSKAFNAPGRKE